MAKFGEIDSAKEKVEKNLVRDSDANSSKSELDRLESRRIELNKTIKKTRVIAVPLAAAVGFLAAYFYDLVFGVAVAIAIYFIIIGFLTHSKILNFRSDFKRQVICSIVKSYGLNYDERGGLGLNELFIIYNFSVDRHRSEDLIYGKIDDVGVRFSDFYAAREVRRKNDTEIVTLFRGVLFEADFHKKTDFITQICHKRSSNLVRYGKKANMDDAKFEEIFDVYTTDQIGARYVLTPVLMQKLTELHLKFNCVVNAVFVKSKIYIAIETWRNSFEPSLDRSLKDDLTIEIYKAEIERFTSIVKELNLNRKIWALSDS